MVIGDLGKGIPPCSVVGESGACVDEIDLLRRRLMVKLLKETDSLRIRFLILSMILTAPCTSSSVTCTLW